MIFRKNIQANPNILFIFGDNDLRVGYGGMAKEFRGEPNSIGIRTKKYPTSNSKAFYTDSEYEENCAKIKEDIELIKKAAKNYIAICIPEGIGSGLAKLDQKAPKTYEFLMEQLQLLSREYEQRKI